MASFMAPFPRIYFCYVEPLLLCYGGLSHIINPGHYTAALFGDLASSDVDYLPTEKLAGMNLGFMMLLVGALVAVVMFTCENRRTAYLVALALMLSDIAHWGAVAAVLGPAGPAAIEVANWTTEMKGWRISWAGLETTCRLPKAKPNEMIRVARYSARTYGHIETAL
ncbi:hypothetical protein OOU_Y34scaffold00969g21 [Pyricularia oryzae Y34]|uniref:DUF7704 domain-containing protein n=3 Tax=Pyricularia oryzae TaxID=318829 RepID=Q2KH10_PYRO7|nr:hypothetical protein MGCH7_ch7g175 [Pyricularia oryzae 70-15]ELQ33336.1 hypothetical protein OOU_Y34scaffold00969g21 [Pyricularia oryzae Y34]